jgi:hypothetical protein
MLKLAEPESYFNLLDPVRPMSGKSQPVQTRVEFHAIKHLFYQKIAATGSNFLIGKGNLDVHWCVTKACG